MQNIGRSGGAATAVLVGLDQDSTGLVRETLAAEAAIPGASIPFGDAIEMIDRAKPDVVIVGYSAAPDAALALAQTIQKDDPNLILVALAHDSDANAILGAMRAGFNEWVVLPKDSARLRQVVHEAAFSSDDDEEKGRVIALTGAKGGVGTTTIAMHLAAEFAGIHRVCLIDLDFGMGDLAPMLDLNTKDSIADVLGRADRLDERSFNTALAVHRTKVSVLPTPEDTEQIGPIIPDEVYAVINVAAKAFQYVIIDCGAYYDDAVVMSLNVADHIVLITTPDITSVRDSFRRMKSFNSLGIDKKRVRLVVNRWHKGAFVKLKDISQNLGVRVSATIADDAATIERALNEGRLAREINKRSEAARDFSKLVAVLGDDEEPEEFDENESNSSGWFWPFGGK